MNKNFITLVLVFGLMFVGFVSGAVVDENVYEELDKGESVRVIVKLNEPEKTKGFFRIQKTSSEISNEKREIKEEVIREIGDTRIKHIFEDSLALEISEKELENLNKNMGEKINSIVIDKPVHAFLQESIPLINANSTWNLQKSNLNLTGKGQTICILDTGINFSHPDLQGKNLTCIIDCFNKTCIQNCNVSDDNGHGTHVAGIAGASEGINGVAVNVSLIGVKVLDSTGSGYDSDVLAGMDWCINNASIYNISVISMSLGGDTIYSSYCDANINESDFKERINNAVAKNISVVVATGNAASITGISSPACIQNATRVGATIKSPESIASFTNRGANFPDTLLAPGYLINSTNWTGGYVVYNGTSMATPMVAGAIALINQYLSLSGQTKTPQEIESVLNNTGKIIYDENGSRLNFSRIDVYSAILSLDVDAPDVTLVSPVNNHINLTTNQTFICNATDWQLANITLKIWNSTELYYNATNNLTGTANETSFDLTNMPEGNYLWNCFVGDVEGNFAYALENYSLTIGGIVVNLTSPENNSYTNANQTNFICNLTSEETHELSNVTFYLWNSSTLIWNETKNINGTTNETIFNWTLTEETNYSWNCLGVNNVSYNSSAENNFTITYDVTSPNISGIDVNPISSSGATITWTTENDSSNSSVWVSGGSWSNSSDYTTNHLIAISGLSASTNYNYVVTSYDRAGNCNNSVQASFTTIASPPVIPSSSSGGGGGSRTTSISTAPKTYEVTVGEVASGYTQSLKKNEKMNFSIFDFEGGRHLLTVNEVGIDYVNLTIESEPINLKLGIGQSAKLNLMSEIYYDLFVKLNSVVKGVAELTIQLINEPIEVKVVEVIKEEIVEIETIKETEDYFWVVVVLVVILILIVAVVIRINRKKLKTPKSKKKYGKRKKIKT